MTPRPYRVQHRPNAKGGRDFVVGNTHGHFVTLEHALDILTLDPARDLRTADALVALRARKDIGDFEVSESGHERAVVLQPVQQRVRFGSRLVIELPGDGDQAV